MSRQETAKKALATMERLKQCHIAKCKKHIDASIAMTQKVNANLAKLRVKLEKNKMNVVEFNSKVTKALEPVVNSEESYKIIDCSLKNCKKDYDENIKGIVLLLKDKELRKIGNALLKKKDAPVDEYIAFLKKVMMSSTFLHS